MKIISTNIGQPTTILWRGKKVTTGIYKRPVDQPIFLGKEDVRGDEVTDRNVHGGIFKACYLFSEDNYPYWQELYPDLDWVHGMFGENLTVRGLDETKINVGAIFKIGKALVQITQPREPCFKFGVKFGSNTILKQFVEHGCPGTYIRVLEEGYVAVNDPIVLVEEGENSISVSQFFHLLFAKDKNQEHLSLIINNEAVPQRKRVKLSGYLK
jgi:MOSC domain-containing protein YiiM